MDKKEERFNKEYVFGDIMLDDEEFFGDDQGYLYSGYFEDGIAYLTLEPDYHNNYPFIKLIYPTLDEVYADEKMLREVSLHADGEVINYHDVAMVLDCEIESNTINCKKLREAKNNNKEDK